MTRFARLAFVHIFTYLCAHCSEKLICHVFMRINPPSKNLFHIQADIATARVCSAAGGGTCSIVTALTCMKGVF